MYPQNHIFLKVESPCADFQFTGDKSCYPYPSSKCLGVWVINLGNYWQTPKKAEK